MLEENTSQSSSLSFPFQLLQVSLYLKPSLKNNNASRAEILPVLFYLKSGRKLTDCWKNFQALSGGKPLNYFIVTTRTLRLIHSGKNHLHTKKRKVPCMQLFQTLPQDHRQFNSFLLSQIFKLIIYSILVKI